MRLISTACAATVAAVAAAGCHASPGVLKYAPANAAPPTGVGYWLPKRVLNVAIVYTVEQETPVANGVPLAPRAATVRILKPIVVTPVLAADAAAHFVLTGGEAAKSALVESNLALAFDDDGLLQGIDVDVADRTLDVAGSLVSAGIGAAKLAIAGGSGADPTIQPLVSRMNDIYRELGEGPAPAGRDRAISDPYAAGALQDQRMKRPAPAAAAIDPSGARIKALKGELVDLQGAIDLWVKKNAAAIETKDVGFSTLLDPSDRSQCAAEQQDLVCTILPVGAVQTELGPVPLPAVTLTLHGAVAAEANAVASAARVQRGNGLLSREPFPLRTSIAVSNDGRRGVEVFSRIIGYPQFGAVHVLDLSAKRLAERKASVSFGAGGGVKSFKVESGSAAKNAAAQLATSLAAIQKSIADLELAVKAQLLEAQTLIEGLRREKDRLEELAKKR